MTLTYALLIVMSTAPGYVVMPGTALSWGARHGDIRVCSWHLAGGAPLAGTHGLVMWSDVIPDEKRQPNLMPRPATSAPLGRNPAA